MLVLHQLDRLARDQLIQSIERHLSGDLDMDDFIRAVGKLDGRTCDMTVQYIIDLCDNLYDLDDRPVHASKEGWDYFQRLLLVLHSDGRIVETKSSRWCPSQWWAIRLLGLGASLIAWLGVGAQMLLALIPLGIGSIWLASWRKRHHPAPVWQPHQLYPFGSWAEMRQIAAQTPRFRKRRFDRAKFVRRWYDPINFKLPEWPFYPIWVLLSPLVILGQSFPIRDHRTRVVLP